MFEILLMRNWARRSQQDQEDYGVDYEIELMTPEDKATGFIFKIQLKGTSVAKYSESGQLVFSDASVERFKYYVTELRIPLVFVVCDVNTGDCFWTKVQGNRQLEGELNNAVSNSQKTFTIKFSTTQKLKKNEESSSQIIDAVGSALDAITLRGLQAISPSSVRDHIGHEPDIESAEKQFRLFAGLAATEAIRKMVRLGDFSNASKKAKDLLESESESPEVRMLGGLSLVHVGKAEFQHGGAPEAAMEAAKFKLGVASRMLEISRLKACPTKTKRYISLYTRAARMHINGRVAMALAISENTQALQGVTIAGPVTQLHRMQVSKLVSKDFFKLRDKLYRLGSQGYFSVMPYVLSEIAEGILPFLSALRILERENLADGYVNALFDFLPFCVKIVGKFNGKNDILEILNSLGIRFIGLASSSSKTSTAEMLSRFAMTLEGTPAFSDLDAILAPLQEFVKDLEARSNSRSKPSIDELRVYFAHQAAALGINLNDPNDRFAKIVKIGLDDLDPTRVVKNCQHIHVMTTSYGMPAQMLGLQTAGSKKIVCLKHGHSCESLTLDGAYETFAEVAPWAKDQICCENCPDKVCHPSGWTWSEEWHAEQHAKYQKFQSTCSEDQ